MKYPNNVLKEIIHHKCTTVFEEAQNIANDFEMSNRYKDLFIEQSKVLNCHQKIYFKWVRQYVIHYILHKHITNS